MAALIHVIADYRAQSPTDESLFAVGIAALRGIPHLDADRVTLTITDRNATLTGEADTHELRRDARHVIEAIAGIGVVHNELEVRRSAVEELTEPRCWDLLTTG